MSDLPERLAALSTAKRALLERLRIVGPAPGRIPSAPDGPAPLSFEQRRLWYQHHLAPGTALYTVPLAFHLRGPLDADALGHALRALVARHEPLRTRFKETDGEPVQIVCDGAGFSLGVSEMRGFSAAEAREKADAFFRRPFDLSSGEPFRALLQRLAHDEHRLLLAAHHLASDGWSNGVLLAELSALYAARVHGASAGLPPLPARYRDWAAWQRRRGTDEALAADLAWWRRELQGAPHVLEAAPDFPRPPVQAWDGARHAFEVSPPLADAVRTLARREGTTTYAVVAAAFALVLRRYSGEDDFLLATALANRPRPEVEGLVGFFANTLPLRMRLGGDPTARELLRRAHAAAVGAQEHASVPFDRIVDAAGVRRDRARAPLVQHILTFTDFAGTGGPPLRLPGVAVTPEVAETGAAAFDLLLVVEDRGGPLAAELHYATALYERATVERMARHLEAALARFAADPERRLSALPLATDDEARQVEGWNRTSRPVPRHLCLHRLFERQARAAPDAVAVVHGETEVTYAALNRRANRIAHGLRRIGVGPETRVGVCLERTPALAAALLGVLKAGGAYVPLDPAHPPARHDAVLRASSATAVLVEAATAARFGALPPGVVAIDVAALDLPSNGDGSGADPELAVRPENLAYVIFTSGSTGGPKGVEIEHRSAVAMLHDWLAGPLGGRAGAMLGSSTVAFDVSVVEVFGTLSFGGSLVLVENALAGLPPGRAVRAAVMVPTAAAERLRLGLPAGLRTIVVGGEVVTAALVEALHRAAPGCRVVNIYGPTEITTYATWTELPPGTKRVTVGRPLANGRVHVLDEGMNPAGIGVPGEIWVGGAGVARGYAGKAALTAARFLPDPHGPAGARMYRTLDLGRWRPDGTLEFLGRRDAQVKVRGHRVELEEVEQALAAHPAVAEAAAAAAAPEEPGVGRRLVGYLVPSDGARPAPAELREHLRARLPEAMVPTAFAWIDALPRTASGKLDRRALPPLSADADGGSVHGRHVAPRTVLESKLATLWSDVLGVERVGVDDDFFDLGGQSILATRLASRVRAELGAALPVAELLRGPTIAHLARWIEERPRSVALPLVPLQPDGERPPLFLAPPGGGHVVCYRTLASLLAPAHPVYGLQARGIEDGKPPLTTVEELAAYYVAGMRALQPRGPYHVGGWSFGGMVAWEIARQLDAAGEDVGLLALLDTGDPTARAGDLDDTLDHARVLVRILADLVGWAAAGMVRVEKIRRLPLREQALEAIRQVKMPRALPESRVDEVLALTAVRRANLRALVEYPAPPYAGHLTYFRTAGSERMRPPEPGPAFWAPRALGGVTLHRVTGSHGTILHQPHVAILADHLAAAIASVPELV